MINCNSNCKTCTKDNKCDSCDTGKYLKDGDCLVCGAGNYLDAM